MTFKRERRSGFLLRCFAAFALMMVFGLGSFSEASNATGPGVISARAVDETSILLIMPYTGDDNGTNTYTVEFKPCTEETYTVWITNAPHANSPYKTTITGLASNTCYDIKATFNDTDNVSGVAPQTIRLASTWDNTLLHNVNRFLSSDKWTGEGGWGLPGTKYGKIDCETCHTPRATNIKGISGNITAPDSTEEFPGQTGGLGINFMSLTTPDGFGDDTGGHSESRKICEYCHLQTTYHRYDTAGQSYLTHNNNTDCLACHPHAAGFYYAPSVCGSCHGNPPVLDSIGGPEGLASGPETGSLIAGAHNAHTAKSVACTGCHYNSAGTGGTHKDNSVTLGFYAFDGGYQGGAYDGQATVNAYNVSATIPATTVTKTGTKTCSNIYCHGVNMAPNGGTDTTPVWDSAATGACGTCHGATAANPPLLGSHRTHTMNTEWSYAPNTVEPYSNYIYGRNMTCTVCHNNYTANHVNGKADWSFDTIAYPMLSNALYKGLTSGAESPVAGSYGQCANVYCHSIIQTNTGGPLTGLAGEYKTPTWGNRTEGNCGSCHAVDAGHAYWSGVPGSPPEISTGSHTRHLYVLGLNAGLGSTPGAPGRCAVCHNYVGSDSLLGCSSLCHNRGDLHVNYQIDIKFAPRYGGSSAVYNGSPVPGSGFSGCSNTYCHSNGVSVSKGTIPDNTSLNWGSETLACNSCHAYPPDYTNGSPKANSHNAHSAKTCNNCHYSTTTDGTNITNYSKHVNRAYDLLAGNGTNFSYTYSASGGSCSNISCHSNSNAQWGLTLGCNGCHGNPPDTGAHLLHTDGSGAAYGNDWNGSVEAAYIFNCGNCHPMDSSKHADGTVDIELFNANATGFKALNPYTASRTGTGTDTVCNNVYCHSSGQNVSARTYKATPQWGSSFSGNRCSGCHDDPPMYDNGGPGSSSANSHIRHLAVTIHWTDISSDSEGLIPESGGPWSGAAHGDPETSTTIGCNICHAATVGWTDSTEYSTQSGSGTGSGCDRCHDGFIAFSNASGVIKDRSMHVNGSRDLIFKSGTFNIKAQLQNSTFNTYYQMVMTRNSYKQDANSHDAVNDFGSVNSFIPETKSCAVICHGETIPWGTPDIGCSSCHVELKGGTFN